MIYLTQGHEKSIAFETFIKSFLMLPSEKLDKFIYIVNKECIEKNSSDLNLNISIKEDAILINNNRRLNCLFIEDDIQQSSFKSIIKALGIITEDDILVTLPTSKDKFILNKNKFAGHTEFFRSYFHKELTMNFINESEQVLILTDHVAIENVSKSLTIDHILNQIEVSLKNIKRYFNRNIKNVVISGINPHAGESGIISNDDKVIEVAVHALSKKFKNITFIGPVPADTQFHQIKNLKNTLQVFCHHDQALTYFKFKNGFIGINTTFGLDFLRLSVDHGTAPNLYGLNIANPIGSYFVLKTALEIHEKRRL